MVYFGRCMSTVLRPLSEYLGAVSVGHLDAMLCHAGSPADFRQFSYLRIVIHMHNTGI